MRRLWHEYKMRRLRRKTAQAAVAYLGGLEAFAAQKRAERLNGDNDGS